MTMAEAETWLSPSLAYTPEAEQVRLRKSA